MTALYRFQTEVIAKLDAEIEAGRKRVLLVAPTGSGKTIIASAFMRRESDRKRRVLFLSHRRELTKQTAAKLFLAGVDCGIIQAGFHGRPGASVQVASVQTLSARAVRTRTIDAPEADIVVIDEAHHVLARSYQKIIDLYPNAIIIGLTATPCRGDGRGLGGFFQTMVECPSVAALISAGYLVGTRVYAPTIPDLKGVRVKMGDYVESQLAEQMDKPKLTGDIIGHWHKLAQRRPTVVFATNVSHSVHIRDEFRNSGVICEHLDGSTPVEDRDAILSRLARGEVEIVTNCAVLTEGWDCPSVSCLVLARPTKSIGLYRQMVGRCLRPSPGKDHALILDHAGATFAHGFAEDDVVWTLQEDDKAVNVSHARRGSSPGMPKLVQCPECMAVMFEGRGCQSCGWRPRPRAQAVKVRDGVLGEVGRDREAHAKPENRRLFYCRLLWIARDRSYREGRAAHQYKRKFGAWPKWKDAGPIAPDEATLSWVRSRMIAYARRREKEAEAA